MGIGEWLSLACAVCWATAVILFKKVGDQVPPYSVNLFKNTLGFLLFLPVIFFSGEASLEGVSNHDLGILLISGLIGIGIADTIFFMALNRLGAGLTAVVECLYSPFVITLSVVFLGEELTSGQILGCGFVLSGVWMVAGEGLRTGLPRRQVVHGAILGALSMALMGVGIVIAKPVLARVPLLLSVETRLFAGAASVWLLAPFVRRMGDPFAFRRVRSMGTLVAASFIGTFLSMAFWLGGVKYAKVSVASVLNQTAVIITLVLAALFLGEPLTFRRAASAALAIAGVVIIAFA